MQRNVKRSCNLNSVRYANIPQKKVIQKLGPSTQRSNCIPFTYVVRTSRISNIVKNTFFRNL